MDSAKEDYNAGWGGDVDRYYLFMFGLGATLSSTQGLFLDLGLGSLLVVLGDSMQCRRWN